MTKSPGSQRLSALDNSWQPCAGVHTYHNISYHFRALAFRETPKAKMHPTRRRSMPTACFPDLALHPSPALPDSPVL